MDMNSFESFMPHGCCMLWIPALIRLHIVSDVVIAVSYFLIPILLWWFTRKVNDLPYKWMFTLFSLFIIACGTTHVIDVITLWYPIYWVEGLAKLWTAAISFPTAIALIYVLPTAIKRLNERKYIVKVVKEVTSESHIQRLEELLKELTND